MCCLGSVTRKKFFYHFIVGEMEICCYHAVKSLCRQRRCPPLENFSFFVDFLLFTFLQVTGAVAELVATSCGILSTYSTFAKIFSCAIVVLTK
uniref:Uncharacterized protein n=1 Tax=Rhipicephalus zambeziensis TaxID=60191 RepID=A0A224YHR1_9ACAR